MMRIGKNKDSGGIRRKATWACLVAGIVLGACAKVAIKPPVAVVPPPGLLGGAAFADNTLGVSLAGVEISIDNQVVTADSSGVFSFPEIPPGKKHLVAEKRFARGAVRRLLGVSTVYVADSPVQVRIRMRDATDVDTFCLDCHPMKKDITRRDQVYRDIHPSGIVPKKANKPTGKFDARGRVTCESCHAIHRETGFPHFTLANYREGTLCLQCH
jgi:hypothetical protein